MTLFLAFGPSIQQLVGSSQRLDIAIGQQAGLKRVDYYPDQSTQSIPFLIAGNLLIVHHSRCL